MGDRRHRDPMNTALASFVMAVALYMYTLQQGFDPKIRAVVGVVFRPLYTYMTDDRSSSSSHVQYHPFFDHPIVTYRSDKNITYHGSLLLCRATIQNRTRQQKREIRGRVRKIYENRDPFLRRRRRLP